MVKTLVTVGLLLIAICVVAATLLPLSRSAAWWVRGWDYPKPQLFFVAGIVLLLWIVTTRAFAGWPLLVTVCLSAACVYHAWRIAPLTPIWPSEVDASDSSENGHCITVLSANVLMDNRNAESLTALIDELRPDVVLLLETDQWWADAMAPISKRYAMSRALPQDNYYGLVFMTDLDVVSHEISYRVEDNIPSIKARLRLENGEIVSFFGLHPRPPTPGVDTDERDAELITVAKEVRELAEPVIVTGDLNDVAWSHTTRLFRRISGMLDPRVGRGLYSTFHAEYWFMRWPLDHLFHTNDFTLRSLKKLPYIGSDHFPYYVELCLARNAKQKNAEPGDVQGDDIEEAQEIIRKGHEAAN